MFPNVFGDYAPWQALLAVSIVPLLYAIAFVCALRLYRKSAFIMSVAMAVFLSAGIADMVRSTRAHGRIHGVVEWKA